MNNARVMRGFTLIELMVTLAIAAVLMMVAAPGLTAFKRNAELTSATNTLLSSINAARGEAMKRSKRTLVVPQDGTSWSNGWVVFVDQNRNNAYDASSDITVQVQPALQSYFTVTGNTGTAASSPPYIMFDPSGFAAQIGSSSFGNFTLTISRNDLSGSAQTAETRRLIVAKTGRARTCNPSTDAACTTTATD